MISVFAATFKEPNIQKSLVLYQKSPTFHQKSPIRDKHVGCKALCIFKNALYSNRRALYYISDQDYITLYLPVRAR